MTVDHSIEMTDIITEPPIFGGSKTADSNEKRVRIQENPDQNQEARLAQELLNFPDQGKLGSKQILLIYYSHVQ